MNDSPIQSFYDDFLARRMIGYRINGNLRLDLAKRLIISLVRPTDTVAEIGCGIGIIIEAIARAHPRSRVLGLDISPENIRYAERTVRERNVSFVQANISQQFSCLREFSPSGYEVLALVDVVEHLSATERADLFANLASVAKPSALLVLTYPSPEYQRWLVDENPSEIQIVDNTIELPTLCMEAGQSGWQLQSFRKVDAWLRGQYVHCVFDRGASLARAESVSGPWAGLVDRFDRLLCRPYRKWYYRDQLLRDFGEHV